MDLEEAIAILDIFLKQRLNDLQKLVFRQAWEGQTYQEIAESAGYDANYVNDVGSKLLKIGKRMMSRSIFVPDVQDIESRSSSPSA